MATMQGAVRHRNEAQTALPPKPAGAATPQKAVVAPPPAPSTSLPTEISELAQRTVVPWGKFKGQSLATLALSAEGCSYLYFIAIKSEPKSEADKAISKAATQILSAVVAQRVQEAQAQPDAAMPLLPFSDEKDKPLHQAHPKWVSMLARKQDSDARSFNDLVLYGVARALQTERGPANGFRRSVGLSDEQFQQLLGEIKGLRLAIEALLKR